MARKANNKVTVSYGPEKHEKLEVTFSLSSDPQTWNVTKLRKVARAGWLYGVKQALASYVRENYPAYATTMESIAGVRKAFNPTPEMLDAYIENLKLPFDPTKPFPTSFIVNVDADEWEAVPDEDEWEVSGEGAEENAEGAEEESEDDAEDG